IYGQKIHPLGSTVLTGSEAKAVFDQCSRSSVDKIEGYWNPTDAEIKKLEVDLLKFFQSPTIQRNKEVRPFQNYIFQYAGFIKSGQRRVYVNACSPHPGIDWKNVAVVTCDTGPSQF